MFGLDEFITSVSEGARAWIVVLVAVLRGLLHTHVHDHDGVGHGHLHSHAEGIEHGHPHRARTKLGSFAIGLVHGMGGSAGVGILLVASIESQALGVISLALVAIFSGVSMTVLSTGFGAALGSRPLRSSVDAVAPGLGVASLAFAVWYGAAAWALAPYPF